MIANFNPKVSIIIPVYNGSNYLKEAIDSALSQTYKNIEIIVVNDGSNDRGKTEKICKSYGNKIRYFKKENGGVASALNLGIEKMRGDYFSWLSHDDVYYPHKVKKQVEFLSKLKNKELVLFANYELIDEKANFLRKVIFNNIELKLKPEYAILRQCVNGITLLIPKSVFKKCGNFNEKLCCTQDYDLWMRLMKRYRFVHMEEILTSTRVHSEQDSVGHPKAIPEGNSLWVNLINSISLRDKIRLEGTEYNFYNEMKIFLQTHTPYTKAVEFVQGKLSKIRQERQSAIEGIKVSVISAFGGDLETLFTTVKFTKMQTHKNIELLVIVFGAKKQFESLKISMQKEKIVRLFFVENELDLGKAWNIGMVEAKGQFATFVNPGDLFLPSKIQEQLLSMYLTGFEVSHTSYVKKKSKESPVAGGVLHGDVVSEVILGGQIEFSCIMLNMAIVHKQSYKFRAGVLYGQETCFLLDILQQNKLLGISEDLVIINEKTHSPEEAHRLDLGRVRTVLEYLKKDSKYRFFDKEMYLLCVKYVELLGCKGKLKKIICVMKCQGFILTLRHMTKRFFRQSR